MHSILVLLRKDFALFIRDRGRMVLTFLVPLAMIYVFGQVFGVNRPNPGPSAIPVAVVNLSGSPEGAMLVGALRGEQAFHVITSFSEGDSPSRPMTEADLRPLMRKGRFRFAVVIPPSTQDEARRSGIRLELLSDPQNAVEAQTVTGLLERTLFMAAAGPEVLLHTVRFEQEQVAGRDVRSPMATQLVGGWAMQFLLFALVSSATSLFEEKDRGIFQRMLSGPVPRSAILWSKFLFGVCLGLIQLIILFAAGRMLFGIDIGHHLLGLALVCGCAAATCSAFGMLLASLSTSSETARGLSVLSILLMSALGGAWFPVSFMPLAMQHLSRLTLVYWSITGFVQVLWEHASAVELLPTLGILLGIAAALLAAAWWRFDRGRIFD